MNTGKKRIFSDLTAGQKAAVVITAVLIFGSLIRLFNSVADVFSTPESTALSDIDYTEFENDGCYYIENALVCDAYAKLTEGDDIKKMYFIVVASDKDGKSVYMSLELSPSDDIYEKLSNYHFDDNMNIGDLVISFYCECERISSLNSDIFRYYS